jgi:putative tricarboxylic transport membrane protein
MKRGWQVVGACFLVLFGFAVTRSLSLPLEDALGPGPGFFPLWLSIIGLGLTGFVIAQVSRPGQTAFAEAIPIPDRSGIFRMLAVLVALAAAAATLERLGFRLVAFAFCLLLLPAVGARNPIVIAVFALLASFGVFHVFYYWLKVPLPIGMYGI